MRVKRSLLIAVVLVMVLSTVLLVKTFLPSEVAYSVTVVVEEGGTTDPVPDTYEVEEGESFTVRAIPGSQWKFAYWLMEGDKKYDNPLTILVESDVETKAFFVKVEESPMHKELVNTLENLREMGFNDDEGDGFDDDEMEAAMYVISKYYLDSPIENKQELIDYFNDRQRADGAWGERDGLRPKLAMYILQAYGILSGKPKKSLESFFNMYDTWEEVKDYNPKLPRQDKYHVALCWVFYYSENPPWTQELIKFYEESLDWTIGPNMHERTHILYSYIALRHPFPNPDDIIDTTLKQQRGDGAWDDGVSNLLKETSIQASFLEITGYLYPDRANEIQKALDNSKPYILSTYETMVWNGKICGYFEKIDLRLFYYGVHGAVSVELVEGNRWSDFYKEYG